MAIARKIAYNVLFNIGAKVLATFLALFGMGLITRYLGKDGFGDYALVIAFFGFFGAFADLGLYVIAAREISRPDADEKKVLGNVFAIRLVSVLLVLLLAPIIAILLPYSPAVKTGIFVAALSFGFSSSYGVLNGLFQKHLAMDRVALAEVLGKLTQVLTIFFAVRQDWGFSGIILSLLFSMAVNFALVFFFSRKLLRFGLRFDFSYWKKFLTASFPMGITAIITFLYFKLDTIFLSLLKSSTEVGIYNAAYKVIENLVFFPAMIIGLVLPIMSASIFTDRKRFIYISNETATVFFILIVPLVIGAQFLSAGIIALIGGADFSESVGVLKILIFSLAFIFMGNFFNNVLIAANLQTKLMKVLWLCAAFNIGANLLLIPHYSYMGAAYVSMLTEFLVAALGLYLTKVHLGYLPSVRNYSRIMLSGVIMGAFLWLFSAWSFPLLLLGGFLTYSTSLALTKAVVWLELKSIFFAKNAK